MNIRQKVGIEGRTQKTKDWIQSMVSEVESQKGLISNLSDTCSGSKILKLCVKQLGQSRLNHLRMAPSTVCTLSIQPLKEPTGNS